LPTFNRQDAFLADDAARPAPDGHLIDITTVVCLPISERYTGGQASSGTHDNLSGLQLISQELHQLIFEQALHFASFLPV